MRLIKNWIKFYFSKWLYRQALHPSVGIQQRALMQQYKAFQLQGNLPSIHSAGYKVFSQFEEDGLLLYIFSVIGEGSKTFVEIGANDGINSNCSNLAVHFGWSGLFLEGDPALIKRGERFYKKTPTPYHPKPRYVQAFVKRENINQLLENNGIKGDFELLSIDIDGNDYWVWDALTVASPKVVVIETHTEFGNRNIVVPYDPDYVYPGKHPIYHGASAKAMQELGRKKGYRLVACSDLGINQIYVREDVCPDSLHEISAESTLWHPKTIASQALFEPIKDWEYLIGKE